MMERSIRRSELRSAESTPPPSDHLGAIRALKELTNYEYITQAQGSDVDLQDQPEDELDFRLFASDKPADTYQNAKPIHKIRLRSPSVEVREPAFIRPDRNSGYYFTGLPSTEQKEGFEAAALSAQQVLNISYQPWPGSAYPWKVLQLPASRISQSVQTTSFSKLATGEDDSKRKRPGKKARIKIRNKLAASRSQKEAAKKKAALKEAAEREKRTQRNREKKVKKKLREKAKKSEANSGADADAGE